MTNFSPVITCTKNVLCLSGCVGKQMSGQVINVVSQSPPSSCCFRFQSSRSQLSYARLTISKTFSCSALVSSLTFRGSCFGSGFSKQRRNWHPLTEKNLEISMGHQVTCLGISLPSQKMSLRLLTPKRETCTKVSWNVRPASRLQGGASASLIFGLFVCFSSSKPAYAEAPKKKDEDDCDSSLVNSSHGKKVYRDYYVTGEQQYFVKNFNSM
uniref:Uncharacterized protein n=1 Tax=Nelumbo nucifera TaxID=4432 RepID=A0A822ZBJ3_NELNU|nr:TPA_asm: hypothetical protein HUJ06_000507 [Nelumbo nucifera]